jgi:hypothetical protein
VTAGRNRLYARQGRAATNDLAGRVKELFEKDAALTHFANHELAGGRWNHMYDQTHIGYTYWQEPPKNSMPAVETIDVPAAAEMGVAIEGDENWSPDAESEPVLPELAPDGQSSTYVKVFNRGREPFEFTASAAEPWVKFTPSRGKIEKERRIEVVIDWGSTPVGVSRVPITITGPQNRSVKVIGVVNKPTNRPLGNAPSFIESNGYVSMEAEHFTRVLDAPPIEWKKIPGLGRTLSGMTVNLVTAPAQIPGDDSPRLEYRVHLRSAGDVDVRALVSPTLNFQNTAGLRYALSFDDEQPQVVNIHKGENLQRWEKWVGDNINETVTSHTIAEPGEHVVKFWMVDPGIVLQKLVVDTGGLKRSYLGPPESRMTSTSPDTAK